MNKYYLITLLLPFVLLSDLIGQSSIPVFEKIDDRQGLSSGFTNTLLQDSQGFIWIGTNSGLNRYDGYKSKVFKYDENDPGSISNDWISAIMEDSEGNLWVGTEGGGLNLYIQKTGKFINFRHDPLDTTTISNDIIARLFEDSHRRIWVGTRNGLSLLNKEKATFQNWSDYTDCSTCNHTVTCIAEDESGNFWIGDEDYGLYYFNTTAKVFSPPIQNSTGSNIHFAKEINDFVYQNRRLWIATDNGLSLLNTETKEFESLNVKGKDILDYHIRRVYQGTDSVLWMSTGGSGLIRYDRKAREVVRYGSGVFSSEGLGANSISEILIDQSNNLWIATRGGFVNKFNLKSLMFDHYGMELNSDNTLVNSEVRALHKDQDGVIWAGTNNGVSRYDRVNKSYKNYVDDFDLREDSRTPRIRLIFRSRIGSLWAATISKGLYKYDPDLDKFVADKVYLAGENAAKARYINCVYEKEDGVFWFGTDGSGFIEYNVHKQRVRRITSSNTNLTKFNILCVEEKSQNEVWAGTDNGLIVVNTETHDFKQWKNIRQNKSSLSGNKVRSLYQDENNYLWIGTRTGLSRFDVKKDAFRQYKVTDGLLSDIVYGILPGIDESLWLSTAKGLSRMDTTTMTFGNFVIPQNNDLSMGAYIFGQDGELIVGGTAGFTLFHPENVQTNPFAPEVVITDLRVSNLESEFKKTANLDTLVLPFDQNNVSIEFSALEFTNSNDNEYQYFLEGFNNDWTHYGKKHDLTFTNLNPGYYTLHLKGSNNDGLWNQNDTQLAILIMPPWWRTWLAFCMYVIVVLITLYLIISIRTSYLKRQKEILKKLVIERTRELKEKNERIAEQAKELHNYSENLELVVQDRTEELVKKNRQLAEYAFMNAHNLRVPAANIKGILQLFAVDRSREETLELLQIMKGQSNKLDQVLYDMQKMLENENVNYSNELE